MCHESASGAAVCKRRLGKSGRRGLAELLGSARGTETERWPHRIDLEGRPTLATAVLAETKEFRANGPESFTVSEDGHYVGADGFLVPRDFREFFDRDPFWVRRWVTRRVGRRFGQNAVFDLEQELLLYLCALSPKSRAGRKFTDTGRNGEEKLANRISSERSAACRATPIQRFFGFCGCSGCYRQVQCVPHTKLQFLLPPFLIREPPSCVLEA